MDTLYSSSSLIVLGSFCCLVLVVRMALMRKLLAVPTMGYNDPIMSYISAFRFIRHSERFLQEGCEKFRDRAFKVPLLDRWLIVVDGETLFKTLRDGRDDVLSSWDAMRELLQIDHTLGGNTLEYPYHINIIRTTLNKNLPHMLPLIQDEAAHALETHIGSKLRGQGWTPIEIEEPLKQIVCQIGGRCFVGLPFCRNEEYCKLTIEFTSNVMAAAGVINLFPRVLKPFVGSLFSKLSRHQAIMHRLIGPEIDRRKKMYEESGVDYKDKPNDMLTWILESATPSFERATSLLALRVLNVNFMSIHSTYVFLAHSILNLAAHPGYLDVLREEVSTHLEGQWSLEDLEKCVKLDSFLKESLRANGLGAISLPRKVMVPLTLPDGTVLPVGSIVTTSTNSAHRNSVHYKDPEIFDGLRFAKLRQECSSSDINEFGSPVSKYSLTSTGSGFLTFGAGRHVCPGRFFASLVLKSALVQLILNFDVKMEDEGVRPPDDWMGPTSMPSQNAQVMFRHRKRSSAK